MSHSLSARVAFGRSICSNKILRHANRYYNHRETTCSAVKSEHRRHLIVKFASFCLLNVTMPLSSVAAEPTPGMKRRNLSMDQLLEIIKVEIDHVSEGALKRLLFSAETQLCCRETFLMVNTTLLGSWTRPSLLMTANLLTPRPMSKVLEHTAKL